MDTTVHLIHSQQVVCGWDAQIRDGQRPATPEQAYTAVRTLLRLPDDDVVLHQLSEMVLHVEDDYYQIPLGVEQLAQVVSRGDDVIFVAAGIAVRVDLKCEFNR